MKQILIVEDDELLNKMLVYNLQSESYGIVAYCEAKRPDLRSKTAAFRF